MQCGVGHHVRPHSSVSCTANHPFKLVQRQKHKSKLPVENSSYFSQQKSEQNGSRGNETVGTASCRRNQLAIYCNQHPLQDKQGKEEESHCGCDSYSELFCEMI